MARDRDASKPTSSTRSRITLLLNEGARPDGIRATTGRLTLVHEVARNRDSFWLKALLEHRADPNYNNVTRGLYPIGQANEGNVPENVRLLIKHGADVNVWTSHNYSMLASAWRMCNGEIAMILLEAGAEINPPSYQLKSFIIEVRELGEGQISDVPKGRGAKSTTHSFFRKRGNGCGIEISMYGTPLRTNLREISESGQSLHFQKVGTNLQKADEMTHSIL